MREFIIVLVLLSCPLAVFGAVECSVDDDLTTGVNASSFLSTTTGSLALWYKPTGTAGGGGDANCYQGERLYVDFDTTTGEGAIGLHRNPDLSGTDRLCATNYTTSEQMVAVAYTNNAWTHLVWVHGGGNLSLYKDGVLVSSVASGASSSLAHPLRLCIGALGSATPGQGVVAAAQVYPSALAANVIESLGKSRTLRLSPIASSGDWPLDDCADGATGDGVSFRDRSGNGRTMTGDDGDNNSGLTCSGSAYLSYPWGVFD